MSENLIDNLCKKQILKYTKENIGLLLLNQVDSTNNMLKNLAREGKPENTVLIADSQTGGKGRYNRHFYSPQGTGIYMSILLKPTIPACDSVLITAAAAAAVCEAIEALSETKTQIKWVNDVLINGKKVGGILTEGVLNTQNGQFDWAVLGIGINVYTPKNDFAEEIKDIASSILNKPVANFKNRLCAEIINHFFCYYNALPERTFLDSYRSRSAVLGKEITVVKPNGNLSALALDINNNCELLVRYEDGSKEALNSGEIGIKI